MDYEKSMRDALAKALADHGKITKEDVAARTRNSHTLDFAAALRLADDFTKYRKLRVNDKYKHALLSCRAAQSGTGGVLISSFLAGLRELNDVSSKNNTLEDSYEDDRANRLGRLLGYKYPDGDCDEMVQRYIKRK